MREYLTILLGLGIFQFMSAQNLEPVMVFPDTLKANGETFFVDSPRFDKPWEHAIDKNDTLNLGTYGYRGVYMTIWTDLDTLVIPDVNWPNGQEVRIPITSPKDTSMAILRFQPNPAQLTDEYARQNKGQTEIAIPETYELANIILFLSELSNKTGNHPETNYSKEVVAHFGKYQSHPLIRTLNRMGKEAHWDTYYGFRENSVCFKFDGDYLEYNTPYKNAYWDDSGLFGGQFRNLLYLVQDFANRTEFRTFYRQHKAYYESLVARQNSLLPLYEMWSWLEKEFPSKMDSYKVYFSPLIGGSHSTQRFQKGFFNDPEFEECVMFINSPEYLDDSDYSETLKEGLMSGIVFTEIDHNYVNPTSDLYLEEIKGLIRNKEHWATADAQSNYPSEYAIFNEYMTHSLFCLYVSEKYDLKLTSDIIQSRVALMERRGYPLFKKFNEILLSMAKGRNSSIFELYPNIIEAMQILNKPD